jgi:integrase/recombinase XerC
MSNFLAFTNYITLEKKYSKHTILAYSRDLNLFSVFCLNEFGSENIEDCNYSQIRVWIVFLLDSGLSNRSVNRKLASLKCYYNFLLLSEQIEVTPFLKHKALRSSKKVQVPFSLNEMEKVLSFKGFKDTFEGSRDKFMIELFYATGMRKAELIGLVLSDVDFSSKTIRVLGKRNKERLIPLSSRLIESLSCYLSIRKTLNNIKYIDYLFVTKNGAKIYNSLVYRVINLYFSMASSKLKKSPHVIRHTFATHLINEGADLNSVKELLGHTSLASTQVYIHNSIAKLKDVYANAHPRNTNKNKNTNL